MKPKNDNPAAGIMKRRIAMRILSVAVPPQEAAA